MRVGILTLLWKRRALSELVLDYYNRIETPGVELVKVAVASPEDPSRIENFEGWTILQMPNRPISSKWNTGAKELGRQKVDGIVIIGSDDFVNPGYFELLRQLPEKIDYLTPSGLHMLDLFTMRCLYLQRIRVGAGRFVRRSLLNKVGWEPWESNNSARLDSAMDRNLSPHIKRVVSFDPKEYGITILDVKSGENMWPYHLFEKRLSQHKQRDDVTKLDGSDLFLPQLEELRQDEAWLAGKK